MRAERSFLKHIGGDCRTPIAAYANLSADKKEIKLLASLAHRAKIYTSFQSGKIEDATILGKRAANEIMSKQLLII